jgi:hypothetical protein
MYVTFPELDDDVTLPDDDDDPGGPGGPGGPLAPDPPELEPPELEPPELEPPELDEKATSAGVATPKEEGDPFPTCPLLFRPQHFMVPPSNAAHEWLCPEQMLVAVRPVPRSTVAGRFPGGGMYDPVPSCPLEFAPKHFTLPSLSTAQLKALPMLSDPVETLVAVLPEPRSIAFASGIDLAVVSPYPSSEAPLFP